MAEKKLTAKQARFVGEYLVDLNATQAAIRAGFSKKTANVQGPRLLVNVRVRAAIDAAQKKRAGKVELSQEWVVEALMENHARAMQAEPVRDSEGNETGDYVYQGNVANKALELLGKHLGMYKDRVEQSGPDGGPIKVSVTRRVVDAKR